MLLAPSPCYFNISSISLQITYASTVANIGKRKLSARLFISHSSTFKALPIKCNHRATLCMVIYYHIYFVFVNTFTTKHIKKYTLFRVYFARTYSTLRAAWFVPFMRCIIHIDDVSFFISKISIVP